ncbi:MAG TPA: hypothetical protein VMZ00_16165 [Sporichthya sp.]|nr:hypothetical protein [Sporichthya sp.]
MTIRQFAFDFDRAHQVASLPFGVTPATSVIRVDKNDLEVRFGLWSVRTPLTNVIGYELSGPYSFAKTGGPARLSLADKGLTFATNSRAGVCLKFATPIRGIDPLGLIRHPGLTLTPADPEGFVAAVTGKSGGHG